MGASIDARLQYPLPEGCTIRFFREGDLAAVLDLLDRAFDGWPKKPLRMPPIEHLRWKLSSHELAWRYHTLAELDGRVIAYRPFWARDLKAGDRTIFARTSLDRSVLPEYQRRNLMNAMEVRVPDEWRANFDALLSLSNNWQTVRGITSTHYRRVIDVVARPLDAPAHVIELPGVALRRVDAFDERIDVFWEEASRSYGVVVARTKAYLNWRYADPRSGVYNITIAEEGGSIAGYAVTTAIDGTGHIADVLVLPDRHDVLEALLTDAVALLRTEGNADVECWRFPYHPYTQVLEKLGFDQPRRTHRFSLQALRCREDEINFFGDVKSPAHLMAGDTDLV